MNLSEIRDPGFLKDMSVEEMEKLAFDIRKFLIGHISKTGGHLASNLGVVELTIALHYVFNTPEDKVFFDVGHQCYTHKILTGRADRFDTLRQYKGLSGFQKRQESEHDVWEAGHSSTSLSAALGMAVARDLNHEHYHVVPVIGDGALVSGMALEALNQIGSEKRPLIIVFNDNNMSISRNVGALSHGFSRLRSSKTYNGIKQSMKRALVRSDVGTAVYSGLKIMKDSIKEAMISGGIFEEFNLDYIGPVDGHDIGELIETLEACKERDHPIVVHVITKKGRGYAPCENDKDGKWHGVGPFNISTGKMLNDTPEGYSSWSGIMSDNVLALAEGNENIVAVTPAMIYGSSLQKFFARYPERSFDCGIAEEHAATFCAGLAISGKRPYLEIYSSFMQRAYDQINHDIARMDLPVVIGIDHAGLVGEDGDTHHGVFDIGLLTALPNMIVAQPVDAQEARNLLFTAFRQKHPFAIRFPKGMASVREIRGPQEVAVGSWQMLNDAPENQAVILTYGPTVISVLEKLQANNLPVTVVNCRFFKPVDTEMIRELAARGLPMYVYETDLGIHGLSEMILSYANAENLQISLRTFALPDEYIHQGSNRQLRKEYGIDLNTVMDTVLSGIGRKD